MVTVGRIVARKGVDALLEACAGSMTRATSS
jgi:hypothetical protein